MSFVTLGRRIANRAPFLAIRYSPLPIRPLLPLLAEGADLHLERPCSARLLVELPVGLRNRGGRHQQVRILPRLPSPDFFAAVPHPGGIHPRIHHQMPYMDVLWP